VSATCAQANPFNSTNCNGLFSGLAITRMQEALTKSLQKLDAVIEFSQYVDPATGFVPLVLFMHEAAGGECGPTAAPQNHLWAHRFALGTSYVTQDDWPGHSPKDQSQRLYPSARCRRHGGNTSQIMPTGDVAHETGHGFGLPDLYDTQGPTEGVGQWSLMGSGNFTSPFSPARMDAWSLNELGWITLAPLTSNGTSTFDAVPLSDMAFYVRVPNPNPRGEYFLLENRQRQQSDSALLRINCQRSGNPPGCSGGGLLIWHVDSLKMNQGGNALNAGAIHGLAVVQADGFGNLDANSSSGNTCQGGVFNGCSDRSDAGDPFPGTSGNTAFIYRTNPPSLKNSDGSFTGVAIDSIRQLVPDRTMSFRLRFGALTVARGSDSTATIQFDGANFNIFRDLLDNGSSHTVGFADGQIAGNGLTRWHFASWSDGGAKDHTIVGSLSGAALTATLGRDFKLSATATTGGRVTADTAINLAGDFVPENRAIILTPIDTSRSFCGWTGSDTTTTDSVITVGMKKPYALVANFGTSATITSATARPNGVMGAAYADQLTISGGGGATNWSITAGALPLGVTLWPNGAVSGFPEEAGNFSYTATVVSCDTKMKVFTLSVSTPTLATADVTAQLLGPTSPLNADQLRYLDFLGNNNGFFDIGDFLAWVKATGAPLSPAVLAAQRKGGRR
jgi:M6 family metalloprotease-like protein